MGGRAPSEELNPLCWLMFSVQCFCIKNWVMVLRKIFKKQVWLFVYVCVLGGGGG